jgi:hypothetical protein
MVEGTVTELAEHLESMVKRIEQLQQERDTLRESNRTLSHQLERRADGMDALTQGLIAERDSLWLEVSRSFDIEPREYFEKEFTMGFTSPQAMLVHWLWKRDPKVAALEQRVIALTQENLELKKFLNQPPPIDED